ncbi:cell wall metabolism sensor histidine kinase WalK [Schumannella sp. 10F1B-5-1]|uniref:sensor histidine kinase n=1 Tax=Schumannella sp. 10F1B-5-1 TaxID=2590780 RepID=UPI0011303E2F|nr:HAMP domain-containing sensor histidine kinase [Schumannella sp. 10F1B-5-1]TPW70056.1 HAMP domain-containing histidine kinase [Schumannella sp. 10F1B-5-1]
MTRAPWSLRRRLVVGIVALLAVLAIVVGSISVLALRQNLLSRLDEQVRQSLNFGGGPVIVPSPGGTGQTGSGDGTGSGSGDGSGSTGGADGTGGTGESETDTGPQRRVGNLTVLIVDDVVIRAEYVDDTGTQKTLTVAQIQTLVDAGLTATRPESVRLDGLGEFRAAERSRNGVSLIVAQSQDPVTETTLNLSLIFALVTLAALLLAGVAGTVVVRLALRPLGRVAATATRVAELPLAGEAEIRERVPEGDTDPRTEVGQVGHAFNTMLSHVEDALRARQASEDRLTRFVADASHELRTPLASIRGYAELSQRVPEELPPDVTRSLERIGSESVRMTSLVEDLLLLARLDSGGGLRREEVGLGLLVADAVADAHVAAPEHRWLLELPEEEVELIGDPGRVHQVVANLLANARTHTPAGSTVTAEVLADGDEAVLRISDDGPGIPDELQPKLFGRFVRGDDSRTRATGSTGLGLSIVKAIVDAHHGTVRVESEPGATVFEVRLPLAGPAPAPEPGADAER